MGLLDSFFDSIQLFEEACRLSLYNTYNKLDGELEISKRINGISTFGMLSKSSKKKVANLKKKLINKSNITEKEKLKDLFYETYLEFNDGKSFFKSDEHLLIMITTFNYIFTNSKLINTFNSIAIDKLLMDNDILFSHFVVLFNDIIKQNIVISKKANIRTPLLDCYDEDGDLIVEKINDFSKAISRLSRNKVIYMLKNNDLLSSEIDSNLLLKLLDPMDKVKKYTEEMRLKRKQEKELEKQKRMQAEQRFYEGQKETRPSVIEVKDKDLFNMDEEKQRSIYKYITTDFILKKNILDLVSYDDFKVTLESDGKLSKKQISDLLDEYKEKYIGKMITDLYGSLQGKYKIILERVCIQDNEETKSIYVSVKNAIFDNRNNNDFKGLLKLISSILSQYKVEEKNAIKNLILFPSEDVFTSNLETAKRFSNNDSSVLKAISYNIKVLESQSLSELKSKEAAFHELKRNYATFTIGSLKGYRYGAKTTKICYFQLNVCEENKKVLKELYNMDDDMGILLVFGFGNVHYENEDALYDRVTYIAESYRDELIRINDIFSNPFTSDSLNEARSLIDSKNENILKLTK